MSDIKNKYGCTSRLLHWLVGILIIVIFIIALVMQNTEVRETRGQLVGAHKALGAIVLLLVLIRIIWRLMFAKIPKPHLGMKAIEVKLFNLNVFIMYTLMLLVPLSAVIASLVGGWGINIFDLFTIDAVAKNPEVAKLMMQFHKPVALIFLLPIAGHILIALYHHFILRDKIINRIS